MNSDKKKLFILFIIFIIILISFIIYVVINKNKKIDTPIDENNKTEEEIKEEIGLESDEEFFVTKGSEKLFTIGNIEDIPFEDKTYSKVKISFDNNTEYNALMSQYMFRLVDDNKQLISYCFTAAYGSFKEMSDIFPEVASSNSVTDGYLYCTSSSENVKYLKMSYLLHPIFDPDNDDVGSEDYFFEIKNT